MDHINGTLNGAGRISGTLTGGSKLSGTLSNSSGGRTYPHYDGEYEVTPRLYEQSLETNGKLMDNNVTVFEIPITRTTNPTGGQTVLIG